MSRSMRIRSLALVAATVVLPPSCADLVRVTARVDVNPGLRMQTMTGWEATAQAGQEDPEFNRFAGAVLAFAVDSLGINRLRLAARAGMEHQRALWLEWRQDRLAYREWRCLRYTTVNDNDDPHRIDPRGFHFDELDSTVEHLVLPVKARLEARGERLFLNVNYTAFAQCPGHPGAFDHADPEEYAEFALATLQHLRDRYGLVPDAWEVVLEPENHFAFRGQLIGRLIVATASRLAAFGFHPAFIAPSNTNMGRAVAYFDTLATVPGALAPLRELSYHRYGGVTDENLRAINERARRHGISAAMLEHIGSGIDDLFDDIEIAGVSAWQQFTITFPGDTTGPTTGGHYVAVRRRADGTFAVALAPRARLLRQVFKYVRAGAWRIQAASDDRRVRALAFADSCARAVVVIRARRRASITVAGLPPGRYAATWTTDAAEGRAEGRVDDVPLRDGVVAVELPAAGALTVFTRDTASAAWAACPARR